ncbi:amidase [Pseudochelatococcus sp. B33]
MSGLTSESAGTIARLVAGGEVSSVEVARAFLARVEALNPTINAIVTLNPRILEQAEAIDRRRQRGEPARPLEGVPFVVKDNLPTAGIRTTFGSLVLEDNVPTESAVSVERMEAAGALMLGKTNTSEFATDINTKNTLFGITRNPVDPNASPGGSSGGTAAAVAAAMAPIGLGTDLGGSIRIPASWCGVMGFRPSPGRVPVYPTDYAWDTLVEHVQGPLAATVDDLGLMLAVLSGSDDRDPGSLPAPTEDYAAAARTGGDLTGVRIAYCEDLGGVVPVDPEVAAATRVAARAFEDMGAVVEEAGFDAGDIREIIAGTRSFGIVARFADMVEEHGSRMTAQLVSQTAAALGKDLRSVARAERLRSRYWHRVRTFLERYELVLTPTVGAPPFQLDRELPTHVGGRPVERFYDIFLAVYAFTLVGLPAVSIPCGRTAAGHPVGLQIVGRRLREESVLRAAKLYATAVPQAVVRLPVVLSGARPLDYQVETLGILSDKASR